MQVLLTNKLHKYISDNNPDLLLQLEERNETTSFLNNKVLEVDGLVNELTKANKPDYIIEEACMEELTKDLKPGKYNYIKNILEEEFEYAFYNFQRLGILVYEIANIINYSRDVFKDVDFTEESEDGRVLKYAITGLISEYLSK